MVDRHILDTFRQSHPAGRVDLEVLYLDPGRDVVIVKATIATQEDGRGAGLAAGIIANIEALATSAKVQALADLGVAIDVTTEQQTHASEESLYVDVSPEVPAMEQSVSPGAVGDTTENAPPIYPQRTIEALKAYYQKAYRVGATDLETRWNAYICGVLKRAIQSDSELTDPDLGSLHAAIHQQWLRKTGSPAKTGRRDQQAQKRVGA